MNNKGFTLVELLAVMVILLSISVIAVTNVTASLKRTDEQEEEKQKKIVKAAAKIYFSTEGGYYVKIDDLLKGKNPGQPENVIYIKDPNSISKLNKNHYVIMCTNGVNDDVIGYDVKSGFNNKKCSWLS